MQEPSPGNDLFQRIFSQMTPAECMRILQWAGLITGQVAVPSYLTAESTLTYLHWNEGRGTFYQTEPDYRYAGGVFTQNRGASEVRAILQGLFERSQDQFFAAIGDAARRKELARLPRLPAEGEARTTVVCWDKPRLTQAFKVRPGINARLNVVPAEHAFADVRDELGNIAKLARALAEYPAGQRVMKMGSALPVWQAYHKGRFCFFDREFDTPRRHGLSVERWYRLVSAADSDWRRFWQTLLEQGEILLGAGRGAEICDRLILDAENYRQFWKFRPEWVRRGNGYEGGETLDDVFGDPDWPFWRARIAAASPLPQKIWDTWKNWDIYTDERVFLFDACMRHYLADRFKNLVRIAREYIPRLQPFEYSTCLATCGTHPSDRAVDAALKPFGVGGDTEGVSIYCYGDFESARWYWPIHAEQRWQGSKAPFSFGALLTQLTRLANVINGSQLPRTVFLTYAELPGLAGYLRDGYWQELVCHAALLCGDGENLSGGGIHFYQSGEKATPEAHQLFCDLIRERDEVVQYAHARPVPPAPVESYDRGFLASSIIAGDRRVYRITPNRSTETNVLQSADALEFVNAMEKMMITGGRLHERSQSTIAPLGWWVIGPVDS